MAIKRRRSAAWRGGFKDGKGAISTESGAAHPSCFTMALSLILGQAKLTAVQMDTTPRSRSTRSRAATPSPLFISP